MKERNQQGCKIFSHPLNHERAFDHPSSAGMQPADGSKILANIAYTILCILFTEYHASGGTMLCSNMLRKETYSSDSRTEGH